MYLTYETYLDYGGTLEETAFNQFEFDAESIINYLTFCRLKNDTEFPTEVPRCAYAIIDLLQKKQDALSFGGAETEDGTGVVQQVNDGVSITYNRMDASLLFKNSEQEINKKIQYYLQGVKNQAGKLVLYRGLYPGE